MDIGAKIKEIRKNNNLTQDKLAFGITTKGYISQIEKGMANPSPELLEKLAERLNCDIDDFFDEPNAKKLLLTYQKQELRIIETKVEESKYIESFEALGNININEDDLQESEVAVLYWIKGEIELFKKNLEISLHHFEYSLEKFNESSHLYVEKKIRTINSLATVLIRLNNNKKGFKLLIEAYDLITRHHISGLLKNSVLINLGIAHGKIAEYHSAIRFLNEAYEIIKGQNIIYRNGEIFMSLGICYKKIGDFNNAKNAYESAINYFNLINDLERKAGTYYNLGLLYRHNKLPKKAIKYLLLSKSLFEELDNTTSKNLSIISLAKSLINLENFDKASEYCLQLISEKDIDKELLVKGYIVLGDIGYKKNEYQDALNFYLKAEEIIKTYSIGSSNVYHKLGSTYYRIKNFQKSAEYFYKETIEC